ncbi:hypothetical protein [Pseudomonas sp. FP1742]|uniref:hypothetical protein n=1 Tax=Pseudomonas sp. FP1742 TaxID=2954079 RepID=UPI0027326989|nr:hypothetical protein [Pseudomonas sp. FP1742]WLG49099.1 hypothetical protein PSH64_20490 [Pseudomonas sp. FP1742]
MSQHDMTVANGPGLTVRGDINNALQALASLSSGSVAPSPTFPCQLWADTGTNRLFRRNSANSAWVDMGPIDSGLREAFNASVSVTGTGSANAYTATFVPAVTALVDGLILNSTAIALNTGASTFSPDGMTAKPIVSLGHAALIGGELPVNSRFTVKYSSTLDAWILTSASGGTALAGRLLNIQVITTTSTYTKTVGTNTIEVEGVAAGGGGGGTQATSASQSAAGGGGSAGSIGKGKYDATGFTTQSVTIGAPGVGAAGVAGTNAASSSFGSLMTLPGGLGGGLGAAQSSFANAGGNGASPGSAPTGANIYGSSGDGGTTGACYQTSSATAGIGGKSPYGATALLAAVGGFGCGGSGARATASSSANNGFNGGPAMFIVREYA